MGYQALHIDAALSKAGAFLPAYIDFETFIMRFKYAPLLGTRRVR
jgi:hypothetical protein